MIRKICFAAFAAAALLSCSEKNADLPHVEENSELVTFSVSVPGLDTKSTGGSADDEKTINSLQVFVFNQHGVYEASARADKGEVSITCTAGQKRLVALVNAEEETGVSAQYMAAKMDAGDVIDVALQVHLFQGENQPVDEQPVIFLHKHTSASILPGWGDIYVRNDFLI